MPLQVLCSMFGLLVLATLCWLVKSSAPAGADTPGAAPKHGENLQGDHAKSGTWALRRLQVGHRPLPALAYSPLDASRDMFTSKIWIIHKW
jgi:hypothetical protein